MTSESGRGDHIFQAGIVEAASDEERKRPIQYYYFGAPNVRIFDYTWHVDERMARSVCKGVLKIALLSLRQRIRSRDHVPAKMEIRAA